MCAVTVWWSLAFMVILAIQGVSTFCYRKVGLVWMLDVTVTMTSQQHNRLMKVFGTAKVIFKRPKWRHCPTLMQRYTDVFTCGGYNGDSECSICRLLQDITWICRLMWMVPSLVWCTRHPQLFLSQQWFSWVSSITTLLDTMLGWLLHCVLCGCNFDYM